MIDYVDFITSGGRKCAIAAHRGAWHYAPENSIAAIEAAIERGYEIVEIDVRKSADGELFILHDDDLKRVAGIGRAPEEFTLKELNAITLRMRDGGEAAEMSTHTIPSLAEVFETIDKKIFVDLDLKHRELFPEVAALARKMGVNRQVDLKTEIYTKAGLDWLKAQSGIGDIPFMGLAQFTGNNDDLACNNVIASGAFMCETKFTDLDVLAAQNEKLKRAGISIWVNTLDPVNSSGFKDSEALCDAHSIWGKLIGAGVSIIQTDEPEALQTYLAKKD